MVNIFNNFTPLIRFRKELWVLIANMQKIVLKLSDYYKLANEGRGLQGLKCWFLCVFSIGNILFNVYIKKRYPGRKLFIFYS